MTNNYMFNNTNSIVLYDKIYQTELVEILAQTFELLIPNQDILQTQIQFDSVEKVEELKKLYLA